MSLPQAAPVPREMQASRAGAAPVPPVFPASSWEGGMGPSLMDPWVVAMDPGPTDPLDITEWGVMLSFTFFKDWHLFNSSQIPCASPKNHGNGFEIASGTFFKYLGVNFNRHSWLENI